MAQTKSKPKVTKLDLRKQHRELYAPPAKEVIVVDVPEFLYLALDGRIEAGAGPSDSESFREAMSAVYGVAYGLKFMSKLRADNPIDFKVMAMEGLWSTESGDEFDWKWTEPSLYTLLMVQPQHITTPMFESAVTHARAKHPNPAHDDLRLMSWCEGPAIQIMHIGPYAAEPATLGKMDAFAKENGYELHGRHHEIYIGDPTKAKPEKLKTILRHPIEI